jgi:ATP-dependent Clp protease adapter protein ClpS
MTTLLDTGTIIDSDTNVSTLFGKPYNVVLYNDEIHSCDEVIAQLMKATGCNAGRANQIMMEAHNTGRAIAFSGGLERCEHVEAILAEIRLGTKIEQV